MTKKELENLKIEKLSENILARVKARWDSIAKPLDGMGRFEELTARIGAILGTDEFNIDKKAVVVMCADNGIVAEGISQSGQEVTSAVAESMGKGRSTVGKFAAHIGADVFPVDIGINCDAKIPGVIDKKIRKGTRNFLKEPAMTEAETLSAIETGTRMAAFCKNKGYSLIATGEMGIGNTTTSSAVAAALLGVPASGITGRGAGLDDTRLARKISVINAALEKYDLKNADALRILQCVGGLDIAGMAGVFIGGAISGVPVVMDGVISGVAALLAERLAPGTKEYMIPSHLSGEPAAKLIYDALGMTPVIDANMALGEGTGAVMMFALLDMAMSVYSGVTTFGEIGVEQYMRPKKD